MLRFLRTLSGNHWLPHKKNDEPCSEAGLRSVRRQAGGLPVFAFKTSFTLKRASGRTGHPFVSFVSLWDPGYQSDCHVLRFLRVLSGNHWLPHTGNNHFYFGHPTRPQPPFHGGLGYFYTVCCLKQ